MQFHTNSSCFITNNKPLTHFPSRGYLMLQVISCTTCCISHGLSHWQTPSQKCYPNTKTIPKCIERKLSKTCRNIQKNEKKWTSKQIFKKTKTFKKCKNNQKHAHTFQNKRCFEPSEGKIQHWCIIFIRVHSKWNCMKMNETEWHTPRPISTPFMRSPYIDSMTPFKQSKGGWVTAQVMLPSYKLLHNPHLRSNYRYIMISYDSSTINHSSANHKLTKQLRVHHFAWLGYTGILSGNVC